MLTRLEDDPLATTIHGRLVTPIPDEQVLQRVVAWNKESEDDENQVQAIATVPQYLIDVQASDSGDAVKLVEANGDSPLRYTALSYASEAGIGNYWESSGLTRDDRIPVEKLSKLLQDAILVTRTLGIPYLWIDSLCIPGDVKDWDRSSEKAGAVHENAYLTISATGTERVSDGLLFARPARATVRIPYGWSEGGARRSVLASPVPLIKDFLRDLYIKMEHEPISKGVWSFQDRALSRRTVHFASDQIYLESMRRFMSEDGYIENHRYHSTANNLPEGTEHYLVRALDDKLPYSRWCAIVYEYGRRKAGKSSDKLLAISNVARRYAALSEDKYIAGHWKKPLLESLAWYAMSCSPSNYPNAPSWSWVSVDGAAALALGYSVLEKEISKVKNTQVILKDETNPFGDVTAASIEIEGPLVPMHLIDKKDDCFGRSIWLQADGREDELLGNLDTMDKNCSASAEALHQMGIFVLALFETRRDKSAPPKPCSAGTGTLRCIIVTPVEGSDNKMKRIGFLSAPVTNLDYDKPEWRKTVVLV